MKSNNKDLKNNSQDLNLDIYLTAILVLRNGELDRMKDIGLKIALFGSETFLKFPLTLYFATSRGSKLGNLYGSFLLRSKNKRTEYQFAQ